MSKTQPQLNMVNQLRVFRAERRITQAKLAQEVGVTRATIIAIEGGNYNPSLELAFRIARYFGVDINLVFSVQEETT